MNIEDLTIAQFNEIKSMILGGDSKTYGLEIGKSYLFRTVTHIEVGRVKSIVDGFVELEKASWIADTGRYHNCLMEGVFSEVEPYPKTSTINMSSMINYSPWLHDLPKEQK